MSDYSEHLISMAGGDGDPLDAIDNLEDLVQNGTMLPGDRADLIAVLDIVREYQAAIARTLTLANTRGRCGWRISADEVRAALEVKP